MTNDAHERRREQYFGGDRNVTVSIVTVAALLRVYVCLTVILRPCLQYAMDVICAAQSHLRLRRRRRRRF